jgi:endonuclease YncB( thermonuclease family)
MRPLLPAILSCLAAVAVPAEPPALTGKAVSVSDGDTLRVLDDAKQEHTIRLAGIDAPSVGSRSAPWPATGWPS